MLICFQDSRPLQRKFQVLPHSQSVETSSQQSRCVRMTDLRSEILTLFLTWKSQQESQLTIPFSSLTKLRMASTVEVWHSQTSVTLLRKTPNSMTLSRQKVFRCLSLQQGLNQAIHMSILQSLNN